MSELSPRTQALLRASRSAREPSPEQVSRVGHSLMLKVASGATVVGLGAAASTASASAASTLGFGLGAKLLVGVAIVAGGWGGVHWLGSKSPSDSPAPVRPREPVTVSQPVAPTVDTSPPAQVISPDAAEPRGAAAALPEPRRASSAVLSGAQADPLLEEARLLGVAQRQLGGGAAAQALGTLSEYDQRFPKGLMRAEAEAARVFALCKSGRVGEARAAADSFVRRHPASPAASRVQQACLGQAK